VAEALLRVLVDTNVWISAFIRADGAPAKVLQAFLDDRFVPVASRTLLEEIREVVDRPRIRRRCRFSGDELAFIMNRLSDRAIEAFPTGNLRLCRDPEDDYLLETAIGGRAEFAVTRDDIKRDLDLIVELRRHGVEVLSVAQFLELLAKRST
jgi:putative PIN family toxin of toxin-antitoxin system